MTAMEELKAWCEKHLGNKCRAEIIPETTNYYPTLYIISQDEDIFYVTFDSEGGFLGMSETTWDEFHDHVKYYEETCEKAL